MDIDARYLSVTNRELDARLALMRAYLSARRAVLLAAFIAGMIFEWGIRGFFG